MRKRANWSIAVAALAMISCSTLDPIAQTSSSIPDSLALRDETAVLDLVLVRPDSWDPLKLSMGDQGAVILADLLYDGLTSVASDATLAPGLATSWTVSADELVWTFELDVERTSVADVVAGLERLRLVGADSTAAQVIAAVERIEPVDETTVQIVLSSPQAGLDWVLSGVPYSIVPGDGSSTGPYSMATQSDVGLWLTPTDPDASSVRERDIAVTWAGDDRAAAAVFDRGDADLAVIGSGAMTTASSVDLGGTRSAVRFVGLAPASPVLADVRIRHAVLAATDRGALAEVAGAGGVGPGPVPVDSLVAPTTVGFSAELCPVICAFDPDRSVALLAEVGTVPALTIGVLGAEEDAVSALLAEQLRAVGFAVEIVVLIPTTFDAAVAGGDVDLFSWGWVAPGPSIDAVLPALLSVDGPGHAAGSFGVEIDATLAAAMVEDDDITRWDLLQQAHRMTLDGGWVIPLAAARNELVAAPSVAGVTVRGDGSIEVSSLP